MPLQRPLTRRMMSNLLASLQRYRGALLAVATLLLFAFFSQQGPGFASGRNLLNLLEQSAVLLLLAVGMTAVILVRGIDLSVGANLALSSVIAGLVLANGSSAFLAVVAALVSGLVVGVLNGVMVARVQIAPFMVTLAMMGVCTGAALALSDSASILVRHPFFSYLAYERLFGVPIPALLAAVVAVAFGIALRFTRWGRYLYAVGGNPEAARLALLPVGTVIVSAYALMGLLVGVSSVLAIGRAGSAQPVVDQTLAFSAISAVIIGGTRLTGGVGSLHGTVLGVALLAVIRSGMSFMGVRPEAVDIVIGVVVVLAVASTELRLSRRSGRPVEFEEWTSMSGDEVLLAADKISKKYGPVTVLQDVSLTLRPGEVVALLGENGAGKTTLVSILAGEVPSSSGTVSYAGGMTGRSVAMVHQHLAAFPDLRVWENLFAGTGRWNWRSVVGPGRASAEARDFLEILSIPIDAYARVTDLTLGERQMLEIARAFFRDARVLVLDEATSAISQEERDVLHALIRQAATAGKAIVYISHRMEDVFHIADRSVVLRDGMVVGDLSMVETSTDAITSLMVGRTIGAVFPYTAAEGGQPVVLSLEAASDGGRLKHASLEVRAGEIVGIAGLMGSGRSELLQLIMGHRKMVDGKVALRGEQLRDMRPVAMRSRGVAMVPEDRLTQGLFPSRSVGFNFSLPWLFAMNRLGAIDHKGETEAIVRGIERFGVHPKNPDVNIGSLSGGNQQKVLLGRWLEEDPLLLLLDEPTRGVDVGAKQELHAVIGAAKRGGCAVLMVSSELPELLGVSDRIVVMQEGVVIGELGRGASEEDVASMWFAERDDADRGLRVVGRSGANES